jgi:hypothetical protein
MDGREKFVWHVAGNRQDLFGWPNTYVIRVYIKLHILQTPTGARLRIILYCNFWSRQMGRACVTYFSCLCVCELNRVVIKWV